MTEFDIVEILHSPSFSTVDRKGWKGLILKMWSDEGAYWGVTDKRGVSWPVEESEIKVVGSILPMLEAT